MKKSQKQALAVGAGVAALAAAAAGVYMLAGKKNAPRRKKLAKWADSAQKDVLKQLKKASNASQTVYNKVVDEVVSDYKAGKKATAPELASLARDLKGHWGVILKELKGAKKTVRKIKPKAKATAKRKVKVKKTGKR